MARYGLDLQQKNKGKRKKTRIIIVLFLCFALTLGTVSTFLLWRSLNYDFNNIFLKTEEGTTSAPTTELSEEAVYNGRYSFLIAVASDDMQQAMFFNIIDVDLSEKVIRVMPVNGEIKDSKSGMNCYDMLTETGITPVVNFLERYYEININRYVLITESNYKAFFRAMGELSITLDEAVEYDTADMFLELSKGSNTLTPDKAHKYMKYLCETQKGYERAQSNAQIVVAAFENYFTAERFVKCDTVFSTIINYCSTDISIVDFTGAKDEIEYLMPKTSKEKVKVFISDNIKDEISEDVGNEEK